MTCTVTIGVPFHQRAALSRRRGVLGVRADVRRLGTDPDRRRLNRRLARRPQLARFARTHRQRRRLCARLNQIVSLAQGTYFARMDADDLMYPERIELQVTYLQANLSFDVI
jgi:Glycosyl transferase family 2